MILLVRFEADGEASSVNRKIITDFHVWRRMRQQACVCLRKNVTGKPCGCSDSDIHGAFGKLNSSSSALSAVRGTQTRSEWLSCMVAYVSAGM